LRILERYLIRQLVVPLGFAFMALTGFLLLNQIARRFGELAGKGLPWSVIGEVFLLTIPFIIAMTLPMAIMVAILYALSHLAADNEITAMRASGISVAQILAPLFGAGIILGLINFAFTDQILPRSNSHLRSLLVSIQRKKPTLEIHEQIINGLGNTSTYLRAGRVDPISGRMRDVSIYDLGTLDERRIIYADSGRMIFAPNEKDLLLLLWHGSIHGYRASEPATTQVTWFEGNTIRIREVANRLDLAAGDTTRGDREMSTCELLGVVKDARHDAEDAAAQRAELVRRDLRRLVGLVPDPPAVRAPSAGPGGYCPAFKVIRDWLLPETAAAQNPAPHDDRRPLVKLPGGILPPGPRAVATGGDSGVYVPLTSYVEVSSLQDEQRSSERREHQYMVEVHKKWALSVSCLVFVLVGIPLALRFPRGGMGLVLGGGMAVFALYYVGLVAGESLGDRGTVSPFVAMWSPNIFLAGMGLVGLYAVRRQAGATRGGDLADLLATLRPRRRRRRPGS
jgi:lipopolysaccharide export system permease protein